MKQRLIVAGVGIPVLLLILLAAPVWATAAMCALLSAVGCYELMHAVGKDEWKLLCLMPLFAAWMCTSIGLGEEWTPEPGLYMAAACFVAVVYTFAMAVVTHGRERSLSFRTAMAGLFAMSAIAAGFACLVILRGISPAVVLTPFIGAFMSDTGAFFAGRAFGKRKLCPAVSPNKTVAGCIGGFVGSNYGTIRNSADIVKAIALGADAVAIGTAALIAMGCHMCHSCHTGNCSWGICTQRPELTRRLNPEEARDRLVNLITGWTHEIKEIMGGMGINSIETLRGNRMMLRGVGLTDAELRILGVQHAGE